MPLLVIPALALATLLALFVGNGNLALALAPALIALLVWGVWFLPLRIPMLGLLVLAWALEAPGDAFANGLILTPWRLVGRLLWGKLSLVIPYSQLVFTGFDLIALLMFAVIVHRHTRQSEIDRVGWVDAPSPIGTFAWLSVAAVVWMSLYGLARGGSFRFSLWQSNRWLYLPIVYTLMKQALRGSKDAPVVGRLLLGVGLFRAIEAISFRWMYPSQEMMPHATTHADSVLFATCVAILAAMILEMPGKGTYRLSAVLLPFYFWAISANSRRVVWAELGLLAVVFWLITPWRPLKRRLGRILAVAALPLLLYTAAGWSSPAGVFSPVQKLRSLIDPQSNTSTLWRDLENFNLIYTFSQNPLLGSGFGHPFIQKVQLPDVTRGYELEPYVPHNSVLGLWAYGGLFGFAILWAVFPVGFFFTVRAYRWARTRTERVTVLGAAAVQVCYVLQGYGDLGFGAWGPVFTVATSYALVGKICVANGAWAGPVAPQTVSARRLDASV
jgi:O-antigen ligase